MKKLKAVLAAVLAAGMMTGCLGIGGSSTLNTESSRIFVTEEGTFQTATVESYAQQDYYSADELKSFLEEAVSKYNGENGQNQVTLDSCTLDSGTARMMFHYASPDALIGFTTQYEDKANQVESIAVSRLSDVYDQSESEGTAFIKASDGKKADRKALSKRGENQAIVVTSENPVTIQTQGRLLFVSDNVVIKDKHTVQTTKGKSYIIYK
ncbi:MULTISPECIES: hypothetical protein [Lacrimispora]|uniref:hypothetical protein n=1 Tax=Lacrimispora TaxID=2719231 RepID=UPI000BE38F0A|nr:hypothetical protein [Lacrimispora amygdalina]MDK2966877.1 hypothetical protein [Lacrimispora sp.]